MRNACAAINLWGAALPQKKTSVDRTNSPAKQHRAAIKLFVGELNPLTANRDEFSVDLVYAVCGLEVNTLTIIKP